MSSIAENSTEKLVSLQSEQEAITERGMADAAQEAAAGVLEKAAYMHVAQAPAASRSSDEVNHPHSEIKIPEMSIVQPLTGVSGPEIPVIALQGVEEASRGPAFPEALISAVSRTEEDDRDAYTPSTAKLDVAKIESINNKQSCTTAEPSYPTHAAYIQSDAVECTPGDCSAMGPQVNLPAMVPISDTTPASLTSEHYPPPAPANGVSVFLDAAPSPSSHDAIVKDPVVESVLRQTNKQLILPAGCNDVLNSSPLLHAGGVPPGPGGRLAEQLIPSGSTYSRASIADGTQTGTPHVPNDEDKSTGTFLSEAGGCKSSAIDRLLLGLPPAVPNCPTSTVDSDHGPTSAAPTLPVTEDLLLLDEPILESLNAPLQLTINADLADMSKPTSGDSLTDPGDPVAVDLAVPVERPIDAAATSSSALSNPLAPDPSVTTVPTVLITDCTSIAVCFESSTASCDDSSTSSSFTVEPSPAMTPDASVIAKAVPTPTDCASSAPVDHSSCSTASLAAAPNTHRDASAPTPAVLLSTDLACVQDAATDPDSNLDEPDCNLAAPWLLLPTATENPTLLATGGGLPRVEGDSGVIIAVDDVAANDLVRTHDTVAISSPCPAAELAPVAEEVTVANTHMPIHEPAPPSEPMEPNVEDVAISDDSQDTRPQVPVAKDTLLQETEDPQSPDLPPSSLPSSQVSALDLPPSQNRQEEDTPRYDASPIEQRDESEADMDMEICLSQPSSSIPDRVFSSPPPFTLSSPPTSPQMLPQDKGKSRASDVDAELNFKESRAAEPEQDLLGMSRKRMAEDELSGEMAEHKRARTKSYSPPPPPNPKRHTTLGQKRAYKKLIQPFRSPLVNIEDVLAGKDGVYASGRACPASKPLGNVKAEPKGEFEFAAGAMGGSESSYDNPSEPRELTATKDRTANAGKPFKALVVQPGAAVASLGVKTTGSTLQVLQARVQKLKQAIKIKSDREKAGDERHLGALVSKWRTVGREVAWLVWDTVKDVDPGDSLKVAPARGRWDGDEVLPNKAIRQSLANDGFKAGWGWDTDSKRESGRYDGLDSSWGWGDKKERELVDENGERTEEGEKIEVDEEAALIMNHSLGTMLRHLGIDPETLGWDEDEGDFIGEP